MAKLVCTQRLSGIGPAEPSFYQGEIVAEVLHSAGADFPRLKHYILDDQGNIRKHVAIFINGELIPRNEVLNTAVEPTTEIHIFQALSGG